jgi:muconolactone delta-isomerase
VQFLVLSRRRTDVFPPEDWTPELIEAEGQRVRQLYIAGIIRTIWRRKDMPGAVIIMEAASEEEAREAAASLPLAKRDMLEVVAFTQLDPYPGFAPR